MISDITLSHLLAGLLALSPIVGQGLIPSSYEGMTRTLRSVFPYSLAGALYAFLFSVLCWLGDRYLIQPLHLELLALTTWLFLLWLIGAGLKIIMNGIGLPLPQVTYFSNSCLALGCGLILLAKYRTGLGNVALASLGMALGFLLTNILVTFLRERIESRRTLAALRGWPSLLVICSILWLALSGLLLLVT